MLWAPFLRNKELHMKNEILELTKQMVEIPSVNGTSGERDIGVFIEEYMRSIPYFEKHPELVIIQKLKDDKLNRRNVFALLRGEKDANPKTVIFHGHTDTVGVEDYGELGEWAFNPDALMEKLNDIELPEAVKKDLQSGEYLFGRGACDMKSGDAVFMVIMKHIAEHIEEFSGNILLSCNPVEENLHTGIIEGIDILYELREKYNLRYELAINNDYTCPMYPGDTHNYIYTGVVGKLLPCFYIQGRETHVGQCFEGYDPTSIAARLTAEINLSTDFCDGYKGEYSLPPVALKMKDLKSWYNVQTTKEALVYFNYFVHNAQMDVIIDKLINAAKKAVADTVLDVNCKYKKFCDLSGKEYVQIPDEWEVMTYDELLEKARAKSGNGLEEILGKMAKSYEEDGTDKREIPVFLIRELMAKAGIYHPVVVLYFAAPYCPHNTLQDRDQVVIDKLEKIVHEVEQEENVKYNICRFFPSLSDSSYLAVDDSKESIELLKSNFPQMTQLYPLPFDKMTGLGIKAVDFGVYGKDAHKWTERVHVPYSFEILPKLIYKALDAFL